MAHPQPPDAVEVMADGEYERIGVAIMNAHSEFHSNAAIPHYARHLGKAALAADPLRQLLGPEAVRAILAGEAAVVIANEVDGLCSYGKPIDIEDYRIDRPAKGDEHG